MFSALVRLRPLSVTWGLVLVRVSYIDRFHPKKNYIFYEYLLGRLSSKSLGTRGNLITRLLSVAKSARVLNFNSSICLLIRLLHFNVKSYQPYFSRVQDGTLDYRLHVNAIYMFEWGISWPSVNIYITNQWRCLLEIESTYFAHKSGQIVKRCFSQYRDISVNENYARRTVTLHLTNVITDCAAAHERQITPRVWQSHFIKYFS